MQKLILLLVNITIFLRADAEASPKIRKYVGYKESARDCSGKPNFSPCNQPCEEIWCSTPYTKCFANKCKSFCWRKPDGFPCGGGLGACNNQSCEPGPDCSEKPDFSPCELLCDAEYCRAPYTKCFDNTCISYCHGEADGSTCGGGWLGPWSGTPIGVCKNQSCEPGDVKPHPDEDCRGKPDFSPCRRYCKLSWGKLEHCLPPYTKCFDNKCKDYCTWQQDGDWCGGQGRGKCKNKSCEPAESECTGKPDFSPCNQWCDYDWCKTPYTKCFDNKCKSYCHDQPDGALCGGGQGKCKNKSCEQERDVKPLPDPVCSGKPDFSPCNQSCKAVWCSTPHTKCYDKKCETSCYGRPDRFPCAPFLGTPLGVCKNESCEPGDWECTGKPNFTSCSQRCLALHCIPPYTKCFDNRCEIHCAGQKEGSPCGGGLGTCKANSCEPKDGRYN